MRTIGLKSSYCYKKDISDEEERLKIKVALALGLFLLSGSFLFSHEETRNLSLSSAGIKTLKIDCGAGFLRVQGEDDRRDIEVKAEILLEGRNEKDAQAYMDKYLRLALEKKGDSAVLISNFSSRFGSNPWKTKEINLTIFMPAELELVIDDGSGTLHIWDTKGSLEINDGSGEIKLENIGAEVQIDDGSGGIDVRSIKGNVVIKDGSGSIVVENVTGSVEIDDGSGSITVREVDGDFILVDDGSGGLTVSGVRGQVKKRGFGYLSRGSRMNLVS